MTKRSFEQFASAFTSRFSAKAGQLFAVGLAFLFSLASARAGEKVIVHFNETHGAYPYSGLTADGAGNFYGMASNGGKTNCGTVFEISPGPGGTWTETVLHSFTGCQQVTLDPRGTMLMDKAGNLYGIQEGFIDAGVIFELTKGSNGTWTYSVVHTFVNEGGPNWDLILDDAGNIYGTAQYEFGKVNGEVFELSPQSNGSWKESVLYSFPTPDGLGLPVAGVVFDSKGNLYGPTFYGGHGHFGAIYELSPQATGPWTLTEVYNFPAGGPIPQYGLTFDSSGNLYGTAGQINDTVVFELTPSSTVPWPETTIHAFTSKGDGQFPVGTLVFDASGNLYGTTSQGGTGCNQARCGTAYKLTPQSGGTWNETILHQFESAEDGSAPLSGPLLDSSGNLFGTTVVGGSRYGYGTVYEITP